MRFVGFLGFLAMGKGFGRHFPDAFTSIMIDARIRRNDAERTVHAITILPLDRSDGSTSRLEGTPALSMHSFAVTALI
jgi:hypothetical protein